jgi:hypothetical protein
VSDFSSRCDAARSSSRRLARISGKPNTSGATFAAARDHAPLIAENDEEESSKGAAMSMCTYDSRIVVLGHAHLAATKRLQGGAVGSFRVRLALRASSYCRLRLTDLRAITTGAVHEGGWKLSVDAGGELVTAKPP